MNIAHFFGKQFNVKNDSRKKNKIKLEFLKIELNKTQKKILALENKMNSKKSSNNETIGITAESVACLIFNVDCELESERLSKNFVYIINIFII